MKKLLTTIILLSFICCNMIDRDTQFFSTYLKSVFNADVPKSQHKFILVSANGCHGCNALILLHAMLKKDNNSNTYIFSSDVEEGIAKIQDYKNIWLDSSDKVNRLKFHGGNSCVMYTSSAKIDSIILINVEIVDSMLNSIEER